VLPSASYNYQSYTKYIIPFDVVLPLKAKIIALAKCNQCNQDSFNNLFSDEFNVCYYEIEVDFKTN
jgi:hypothetical protein